MIEKIMYAWRDDDLREVPVKIRKDGAIVLPREAQCLFGYRTLIWQEGLLHESREAAMDAAEERLRHAIDKHSAKAIDMSKNLAYLISKRRELGA